MGKCCVAGGVGRWGIERNHARASRRHPVMLTARRKKSALIGGVLQAVGEE